MPEETNSQDKQESVPETLPLPEQELVLDLNFVPDWAKRPPHPNYSGSQDESTRDDQHKRDERPRMRRERRDKTGQQKRRYTDDREERRNAQVKFERIEALPVTIHFMPERRQLSSLVRQIRAANRSYPLAQLASLFLSNPDFCLVKIEQASAKTKLYQCAMCKMPASDSSILIGHVLNNHIEDFFEKVEVTTDPPSGQFTCVARCGLTGALLGPPNHHSYAEKVRELQKVRFPNMSMDDYRSHIKMHHEPELIEQWKEESRKQTIFRLKSAKDNAPSDMKWSDAETYMLNRIMPSLIVESRKATLPAGLAMKMEDTRLLRSLKDAWRRENRFPFTLLLAFKAAFRHMSLHVFRAGKGMIFVAAVRPCPLDPTHVVESIKEVLDYLRDHPGCTRQGLVEALRPGIPFDSPDAAKVLSPLGWLIEKGHIIEFYNSTLSVPLARRSETAEKPGHNDHNA